MSVSQHPVALRLEQQVGGATKLLATVMGLPLVDGIFPALIIAGALQNPVDVLEAGLLIFGGSATVAVILAEMDGSPREQAMAVLVLGAILLPVAAVEAMLAQTLAEFLNFDIFHRFAGIVILAIAAKTASSKVGEYLPSPGAIIGLGLVASFESVPSEFQLQTDPAVIVPAVAAVGVGIAFALSVALLGPRLRGAVDIDLFRFGSSVALGMLALSVLQVPGIPADAPIALVVLCVTAVFAFDPGSEIDVPEAGDLDPALTDGGDDPTEAAVAGVDVEDGADDVDAAAADDPADVDGPDDPSDDSDASGYDYPSQDEARAPWL